MEDLFPLTLDRKLGKGITLVCINQICNETGTIHPLDSIARACRVKDIRLLVDGSQAVGHIPVNLEGIPCDYYSLSAHKFGGPRGVGALLIRDRQFDPMLSGGKQEWELRAGTENLAGLAATVVALKISISIMKEQSLILNDLKEDLIHQLKDKLPELLINSPKESRPGFISLSFPGSLGNEIVAALSVSGMKIAMGSACHADRTEPSRIILATGRGKRAALGTIRISMGRGNTEDSVKMLGHALLDIVRS
jgi:cysteine desulfurase